MRSLTAKLTLVCLCSSLISVALVGLYAHYQTSRAFDTYVQNRRMSMMVQAATNYYLQAGSWDGIDSAWHRRIQRYPDFALPVNLRSNRGSIRTSPYRPPFDPLSGYIVVDQMGSTVTNGRGHTLGDTIASDLLARGAPIEIDGVRVGTVISTSPTAALDARENEFLMRSNRILLAAMLGGGVSALIIGIVLTQFLTRPIRALTAAIHNMQRGKLRQEVRTYAHDELGELVRAFNQLSHDLDQATQIRRQMTADIAHELRTPLSVLIGYIETMRDGLLPPSQERFQAMFVEANQLQRLIDDLRLLSLADAGELSLYPQPTNPRELLNTVMTSFAHQAEQKSVEVHVETVEPIGPAMLDQARMLQVLSNLLSNALRYTPAGGKIALSATQKEEQIQIEVRDTGCGIAPDALPYVFERLYRADPSRVTTSGGTGLGLAIVKAIVEAHGGAISAESKQGSGTRMIIALPCSSG